VERVNLNKVCHHSIFVRIISINIWGDNTALANVLQHVSLGFILLVYDMYWLHYNQRFILWSS